MRTRLPFIVALICRLSANHRLEAATFSVTKTADTADGDEDGHAPEGGICGPQDCDDANADVHPGVRVILGNGVDDNCDGLTCFVAEVRH